MCLATPITSCNISFSRKDMIDIFDGFKTIKSGSEMKSKLKPPTKAGETEV